MKAIILLLAIVGLIMITAGYVRGNLQCPPETVQYRYITKTFDQEQDVSTPIMSIGGMYGMFEDDSPWFEDRSFGTYNVKNNGNGRSLQGLGTLRSKGSRDGWE